MLPNPFTEIHAFGKERKISQADNTTLFSKSTEEVSVALYVISKCSDISGLTLNLKTNK